jgi:glycerol-3-phosphate acyltransferase PlsX
MRIVVDAMGSDNYPGPDVEGAVLAAREWGDEIILVGDETRVEAELAKYDTGGLPLKVVHASQVVEMTDKPSEVVKGKPDSSMHVGMKLVEANEADAFVSAGNTGGVLAVSTLYAIKRIRGIKRPALSTVFPYPNGQVVAADIGANAECKPDMLVQFGLMASAYAERVMGIKEPRVALLSNGEEEGKGNSLIHETGPLMKATAGLNYIGNVEPKEMLSGMTDVIIHDGFTGNVMMKSLESGVDMLVKLLRQEIKAGAMTAVGGLLAKPAFKRVGEIVDPAEIGGARLLGLNGVVIIGHGRSDGIAIKNAVRQAREAVQAGLIEAIRDSIAKS